VSKTTHRTKKIDTTAGKQDTVELTETARDIRSASTQSIAQPEVDEKRVADIKAALEAGRYTIDPERVAKKLMDFETRITHST